MLQLIGKPKLPDDKTAIFRYAKHTHLQEYLARNP